MIITILRMAVLFTLCLFCGVLGLIWVFGSHASIFVTIGVKPLGLLMLGISIVIYEQMRREWNKIENIKHQIKEKK